MPKAKQARPPTRDDPAQSERFMKDAAKLASADGAQLFERAMESLVQPATLPVIHRAPIIQPKVDKKKSTKRKKVAVPNSL